MDNGPEFIADAIKAWCDRNGAETSYIDPGSPWPNPYVESVNSRARDEVFAREVFDSIIEAKVIHGAWHAEYNSERPHSSLGGMTPLQFFDAWCQQHPGGQKPGAAKRSEA
jgi:putative transposase